MTTKTQISAFISAETKSRLDRFVEGHGVSQAFVVEQALAHHLAALDELPSFAIVPTRVVLSPQSGAALLRALESPAKPSPAMRKLFR